MQAKGRETPERRCQWAFALRAADGLPAPLAAMLAAGRSVGRSVGLAAWLAAGLAGCASMPDWPVVVPEQPIVVSDSQAAEDDPSPAPDGPLSERVRQEREEAFNPYVITAHRHNYVLPLSYTSNLNEAIYRENEVSLRDGLQPAEVTFQVSLKTRLNERDLFYDNDALSFGLSIEAWWQLYSSDLSSPFRETNYEPELMYFLPLEWRPFNGYTAMRFGLLHESNGQVQGLSRSWNRVYAEMLYERGNFVAVLRPWLRIPEKRKESADDPEGDDNPDILDFMGHGELALSWRDSRFEYGLRGWGNPATGKGGAVIGLTFPLTGRYRGYFRYFNGYGDSLIDYDHFQSRLGAGIALTNLFF